MIGDDPAVGQRDHPVGGTEAALVMACRDHGPALGAQAVEQLGEAMYAMSFSVSMGTRAEPAWLSGKTLPPTRD